MYSNNLFPGLDKNNLFLASGLGNLSLSLQCFCPLLSLLPPVPIPLPCQISVAHLLFQGQANCTLSIFIQCISRSLGKYV